MGHEMTVNRLPAPTWNWLHMNEVRLSGGSALGEGRTEAETPDTIQENASGYEPELAQISTGMGAELDEWMEQNGGDFRVWRTAAGVKEPEPVRLHFLYDPENSVQNRIGIYAGENSEITVIMDYRCENMPENAAIAETAGTAGAPGKNSGLTAGAPGENRSRAADMPGKNSDRAADAGAEGKKRNPGRGLAAVQTKIRAEKGAHVCMVQIQKLSGAFTFLNDVGISCGEGAQIRTIQIFMGGGETYTGMRTELRGKSSVLESKIGYLLDKKETLDMNYLAYHTGAKTTSRIDVSGVLRGKSQKLFRGTIDFRNGSVGAKGDEKEDVLLFSDDVVNRTIPLILCEEEDVVGNHGATIGRLDEDLLFYLASRGMEEEEIYEMMARARIDAICREIPDEKTRRLMQEA